MTCSENVWMEEKKMLFQIYSKDVDPANQQLETNDDEPRLLFHEFIFLLAMIATKKNSTDSLAANKIENFFHEQLGFRKIEDEMKSIKSFEEVKHLILSGKSAKQLAELEDDYVETDDDESSEFELDEQQALLKKFLEDRSKLEACFSVDFNKFLDVLDEELPMIPGLPEV